MDDQAELATIATPVKADTIATPVKTEGGHHAEASAPVLPPQPQMLNGVKIYPPSFVPAKGTLHLPRKSLISMEIHHIEGIHIVCFLSLTFFLFIGMWKRPNLR